MAATHRAWEGESPGGFDSSPSLSRSACRGKERLNRCAGSATNAKFFCSTLYEDGENPARLPRCEPKVIWDLAEYIVVAASPVSLSRGISCGVLRISRRAKDSLPIKLHSANVRDLLSSYVVADD